MKMEFGKLSEENLLLIKEYLLGNDKYLKLHYSQGLRKIQNKFKFDVVELDTNECIWDGLGEDKFNLKCYGYKLKNKNYTKVDALRIMRNHVGSLKKRIEPYWTNLNVRYVIEVDDEEQGYEFEIIHIEHEYWNDEKLREELNEKADRISWEMLDYYGKNIKFKEIEISFEQRIKISP